MSTKSSRTNSKKGPRSIAKDLRSAASALEHGRHSTAQKKLATIAPSFSPRQADTILAALRAYQDPGRCDVLVTADEIASEHGDPLSNEEIDALCEQINCGDFDSKSEANAIINREDWETAILDEALNSAEIILKPLLASNRPRRIADAFETHVRIHLAIELKNMIEHGHRNDDPKDGCTLTLFEELAGFVNLVSAGNSEYDDLERNAKQIIDKMKKLGIE